MSFYASVALNVKKKKEREIVDGNGVDFEVAVHVNI